MSVSDTQYLKWSCTVWEYDTSKIRFKQAHHFLSCRPESTKMLVTIETNWWQIPLFRDDFESLGDLGKETTLDHWSETRWIQLFYYSFSKTKTKSHVGVSHKSSFLCLILYESYIIGHELLMNILEISLVIFHWVLHFHVLFIWEPILSMVFQKDLIITMLKHSNQKNGNIMKIHLPDFSTNMLFHLLQWVICLNHT